MDLALGFVADLAAVLHTIWLFFLALLGMGVLIFVHELGHFIAAKRCGIRVETFCLGFQPTIFGVHLRFFAFRRGDTEYAVGMLPFGGYVKMAGEEAGSERSGAPDEFTSKPPAQRAYVLVAGSAMNILFAFVAFVAAFAYGVPSERPVIGAVHKGSPAWRAGMQSGDEVLAVDGESIIDFLHLRTSLLVSGIRPLVLDVRRQAGGTSVEESLTVTPVFNKEQGMAHIGVEPAISNLVEEVAADSPAARAGLANGDEFVSITLEDEEFRWVVPEALSSTQRWRLVEEFYGFGTRGRLHLGIRSANAADVRSVTIDVTEPPKRFDTPRTLGVTPAERTVVMVRPGSAAAAVLQPGWEITHLNGAAVETLTPFSVLRAAPESTVVEFETAHGAAGSVPRDALIEWLLEDVIAGAAPVHVEEIEAEGNFATLGIEPGARLLTIDREAVSLSEQASAQLADGKSHSISWWDGRSARESVLPAGADSIGARLAGRPPRVGMVLPNSGAARAGIAPGDLFVSLNGAAISTWTDLLKSVAEFRAESAGSPDRTIEIELERGGQRERRTAALTINHGYTGIAPRTDVFLLHAPMLEAFVLGPQCAYIWAKNILLTIKALLRRDVHAKNLSGPLGIVNVTKRVLTLGLGKFLYLLAVISLNLGLFNLMPFPILDGGHLMFLAIEKIKGSPVNEKVQYYIHLGAFALLIGLALYVTYFDIVRWQW